MDIQIGYSTLGDMTPYFIGIGIAIFILVISIIRAVKPSADKKERAKVKEEKKIIYNLFCKHISGLNLPQNIGCTLYYCEEKIEIIANGVTFELPHSKLIGASVGDETEIQQQYVSSAGGAVAGAMLFGVAGALVGGRAKKKEIKITKSYLLITYQQENEIVNLVLDVTGSFAAYKIAKAIRDVAKVQSKTIKL